MPNPLDACSPNTNLPLDATAVNLGGLGIHGITGTIPTELALLTKMTGFFNLAYNSLTGSIPSGGSGSASRAFLSHRANVTDTILELGGVEGDTFAARWVGIRVPCVHIPCVLIPPCQCD